MFRDLEFGTCACLAQETFEGMAIWLSHNVII